jgi:hypothetical protein
MEKPNVLVSPESDAAVDVWVDVWACAVPLAVSSRQIARGKVRETGNPLLAIMASSAQLVIAF